MKNKLSVDGVNEHLNRLRISPIGTYRSSMLPGMGLDPASLAGYYDQSGRAIGLDGENLDELREAAQDLSDYGGIPSMTPNYIVEGISTPGESGVSATDTADNNRSVSVPGERMDWSKPREKSFSEKRKEAFLNLDPNNSGYAAIRAADAAVGRYRQGNDMYYKVGDEMKKVNEETWRKGQHRQLSPEQIKSGYVDAVKSRLVPVSISDGFETDEALSVGSIEPTVIPSINWRDDNIEEFTANNVAPMTQAEQYKQNYFSEEGW